MRAGNLASAWRHGRLRKDPRGSTVLVVAPDPQERDRYGEWLERAGMQVLECPGPGGQSDCIGLRSGACQLTRAADVVVLDHRAGREPDLEVHYLRSGTPIVAVGPRPGAIALFGREWVLRLPWPPTRRSLVSAVRYQALAAGGPA